MFWTSFRNKTYNMRQTLKQTNLLNFNNNNRDPHNIPINICDNCREKKNIFFRFKFIYFTDDKKAYLFQAASIYALYASNMNKFYVLNYNKFKLNKNSF